MSKNFEELLKALKDTEDDATATLAKAQAPAPAAELDDDPEGEGDDAPAAGDGGDDAAIAAAAAEAGAADGEFGKSFEFTDADGNKQKAVDATDLVKSLIERVEAHDDTLAKALTAMNGVVSKQGELIKSLTAQVQSLSSQGRGRKTVLTVAEKPDTSTMAKSEGASESGMTAEQFFAKANAAFDAEKLSGRELNVISVSLRGNHPLDPALIQKVISA
jgi:hypothetical protein